MQRDALEKLLIWRQSKRRKPLLLRGARQVGKTHLLRWFGETSYQRIAYLNLEEDPDARKLFRGRLSAAALIQRLSLYVGFNIQPEKHLLVFDEIQAASEALNSLKYLYEQAPEYHVTAAGSLLGVQLTKPRSFPVGKVNLLDLYPLTFFEFLDALDRSSWRQHLEQMERIEPIHQPLHRDLISLLKQYYFVGGMPEVVATYADTRNLFDVRDIHREITTGYVADFGKYAPPYDIPKLNLIWESVPKHLGRENKKFMYSAVRKSARARGYEDALNWLTSAGLVLKSHRISLPERPLASAKDASSFKVYAADVGILVGLANVDLDAVVDEDRLFSGYRGALVENYVAQQLTAQGASLYYWESRGTAETDFILEGEQRVLPLEAKAGVTARSKSLKVYDEKFRPELLLRTTPLNLRQDGRLLNLPLYALNALPNLVARALGET